MTTFQSITGINLIRVPRKFWFEVIRKKGSHHFLQHKDGRCTVAPIHRGETIGRDLLAQIFLQSTYNPTKKPLHDEGAFLCNFLILKSVNWYLYAVKWLGDKDSNLG
jgi:predicted RNA binding protein YcfA (HicA-like mRNA interferase family)